MNRGDVWWAEVGGKRRPVLVLTRPGVIDVRRLVTVAEISTAIRGLAVEVAIGADEADLPQESVVNCDGLHTIRRSSLVDRAGHLHASTMRDICGAIGYALAC